MANAIVPNMNDIVRPFVSAPTPAASSNTRTDSNAQTNKPLVIKASINSSVDASPLPALGAETKWTEDGSQRVTEKAKVYNPDDETQYVEVERLKECTMIDVATNKKYKMRFADWDSGRKGD
jgi:hypothetical protein